MKPRQSFFILCMLLFSVACSQASKEAEVEAGDDAAAQLLVVYASNYPLTYFAERIAGPLAEVRFPAAGQGDPAYWSPGGEAIAAMQQADLILLNGATYEQWVKNVTLPESRLVNTTAGLEDRLIEVRDAVTHSHGGEGEHSHAGTAFTTWLDLSLAAEQAEAIKTALIRALPGAEAELQSRFASLREDLLSLDAEMKELTAASSPTVFFSHPVYQYLQRRYGIDGHSVHWEPGEAPDAKAIKGFRHDLGHHPSGWMIWEAAPLADTQALLEEMGVATAVFDPCADTPAQGDFLSVMRANVERMRPIFQRQAQ